MTGKRVTIKDVAAEAEVTAQTVSRVFNNRGYVSESTRQKVLDVAKRLNYVPNIAAVSLRTGESKYIAVVFDSLKNLYFSIMVDYIHREVQEHGYMLQTIFVNSHTITESIYRRALSMGASAVISFLEPEEGVEILVKNFEVPLIIFGRRSESKYIDYVTTDDMQGGRLVAERLIADGCKTFLYASEAFGMTCVKDRFQGYATELEKYGYKSDVIDCALNTEEAFMKYLETHEMPDGVFCLSDMIAFDLLNVLKKLGNTTTKVIGYDDISSDITIPVDLTSVGIDKYEYVRYLIARIIDKSEGINTGRIAEKASVRLHIGETA